MPHLNTGPGQHDSTVSAYVARIDTPVPTLMLHSHKKLKRYMQFGGHIEFHENPWDAITHELAEESGYNIDQLQILQPLLRLSKLTGVQLHPTPVSFLTHKFEGIDHYHTDIAFAFIVDHSPVNPVGKGESETLKLFTAAGLRALPSSEIPENVRETGLFVLEKCLHDWTPISTKEWASQSFSTGHS